MVLEKYAGGGATRKVWKSCRLLKLDPTKAAQKAINQVLAMGKIGTIRKIKQKLLLVRSVFRLSEAYSDVT